MHCRRMSSTRSDTRCFWQSGGRHESTKVLRGFGDASVLEVIEAKAGDAYRAVYTVRFAEAVYVLHVFQKKSKSGAATPGPDMELINERLRRAAELARQRAQGLARQQERK